MNVSMVEQKSITAIDKELVISQSEITEFPIHFNAFFNFQENPFKNLPDPKSFFDSRPHREVMLSLLFGVDQRKGFLVVSGEIGCGKTTLCRHFLTQIPQEIKTAVILNPKLSGSHLLETIVRDFGIEVKRKTKKHYFDALNAFLLGGLKHNQNACIIIDEAQLLTPNLLEEIRLLSNIETSKQKLIQIILFGQPELRDLLRKDSLTQLRQRVGVACHLRRLDRTETRDYIEHRINVVSEGNPVVFFEQYVHSKIYEATGGVPRLINVLCDRILLSAFSKKTKVISWDVASAAFEELAFILEME